MEVATVSYNGSGTFNINSTGQPVVAGTVITASAFNALTTDLATGLTTAITKDGQTTTTARITFAQGITSSLVTDSSSVSTGSIITAGGAGIAKNLYVGVNANVAGTLGVTGVATFSAAPIYSSLTASSAVATDASKGLVSVTNTGTGNNVLATSPTITTPTISSLSSASATALTLQSAGTTAITVDTSQNVAVGNTSPQAKLAVGAGTTAPGFGTASKMLYVCDTTQPEILIRETGGSVVTSMYSDASTGNLRTATNHPLVLQTNNTERMRIASDGKVGIGTSSPNANLQVDGGIQVTGTPAIGSTGVGVEIGYGLVNASEGAIQAYNRSGSAWINMAYSALAHKFLANNSEAMRIDSSGNLLIAKTASSFSTAGFEYDGANKQLNLTTSGNSSLRINRTTNDGVLVSFQQDAAEEGTISVSGTTVSYNGGHLSRYAQTTTAKDNSLVKGTVLSNLDAMNVYTDADGNPVANEQLNKVKVSDVEGDANVAGVFVNWTYDEAHQVDEINMAMTGDMIIRIAQGVTVQRGDLLMSAGDGTAKTQGDDIVRSKTIAKVTSNHVTCTYADGSYCVPCVLMAC